MARSARPWAPPLTLKKDTVTLDGNKVLMPDEKRYIILNKPEGYMVSRSDPHQPKTIYTLLPKEFEQLHPVGKVDQNSCGLLLLTNDGELTEKLCTRALSSKKSTRCRSKAKPPIWPSTICAQVSIPPPLRRQNPASAGGAAQAAQRKQLD